MHIEENHREFTRVQVAVHVELRTEENVVIQCKLDNVSFNGLSLRCDAALPERTPCLVFLYLDGGQGGPTIEAQGVVIRTESHRLGIQLTKLIGAESAQHLRNLVLYNSSTQANRIEAEFESHVGLQAKS
ncbi:MAG: PilZ domain-containing protein [Nitrospirales bacterium]